MSYLTEEIASQPVCRLGELRRVSDAADQSELQGLGFQGWLLPTAKAPLPKAWRHTIFFSSSPLTRAVTMYS